MNLYISFLNLLLLVSTTILIRHSGYRSLYFLQMFQQNGYKIREFGRWLSDHFYSRFVLPEHMLFLIVHFSLHFLMSSRLTLTAAALILGLYALFWFAPTSRFRPEKEKKPLAFTPRMIRLSLTHGVLTVFLLYLFLDLALGGAADPRSPFPGVRLLVADPWLLFFGLVLIDISIPLFLVAVAWLMTPVEHRIREGFKKKAREKLARLSGLRVIAVTGSYGKTSTKYMINELLKERLSVCMTPGSFNTPMGICKVINNDLDAGHQILLLEMGARYEGNIAELCGIARPDVAVITNVGKAHLETFGSLEAVAREKSALAREMRPGGLLVLNGDDREVVAMAELHDGKVVIAGLGSGTIRAEGVEYDENGTRFTLIMEEAGGEQVEQPVSMKLLGAHNVLNFLLAAAVAREFGIRPETMALAAGRMEPVEHRLELRRQGGIMVIDDAFNSNPVGARNAIDTLASFRSGRKVIVTPGMVELGPLQEEENRLFGRHIGEAGLDLVILVGREQTRSILEGIRQSGGNGQDVRVVNSLFEANEIVRSWAREGDVILYENDLPDTYSE